MLGVSQVCVVLRCGVTGVHFLLPASLSADLVMCEAPGTIILMRVTYFPVLLTFSVRDIWLQRRGLLPLICKVPSS